MFSCILCPKRFLEADVKSGNYYVSTGVCLECYIKLGQSQLACFGKKDMYDLRTVACQQCPDQKICKTFSQHRKDFIPKEKS